MSWKENVKNWDGKLYKVLRSNQSCYGGDFEWSLPKNGKPGDWTPVIKNVKMCERGYHLTTHYAHWSDEKYISIYEAEGDVVAFDGYDNIVCTKARLLKLVKDPFNKNNIGKNNSGNNNFGDYNSGNHNAGNYNSGSYNSGYRNSGNYNSGWWNNGKYNLGTFNFGNYNSGNHNSGDYNFGYHNSGNYNFGDFNSGDFNSGYFCTGYGSDGIFNEPIPENWEPKFPDWIYFKLLPEGYCVSWQNAFEKANVKGINELLTLPNFDYEIFECITSITREQIEEKLGK